MSLFKVAAPMKRASSSLGGVSAALHVCVVSVCVCVFRLMEVRSEVRVEGHYLQPERCASASSFPPSSLPAV